MYLFLFRMLVMISCTSFCRSLILIFALSSYNLTAINFFNSAIVLLIHKNSCFFTGFPFIIIVSFWFMDTIVSQIPVKLLNHYKQPSLPSVISFSQTVYHYMSFQDVNFLHGWLFMLIFSSDWWYLVINLYLLVNWVDYSMT